MSPFGLAGIPGITPTIEAASIGIPDTMLLMLLALIVFGPRRLPEIGKQIGKLMYEFRKVSNEFKFQMEEEMRASEQAEREKKIAAAPETMPKLDLRMKPELDTGPVPATEYNLTDGSGTGGSGTADLTTTATYPDPDVAATAGRFTRFDESIPADPDVVEERGEPRKFPPAMATSSIQPQPPLTGDVVEAARPFRGRVTDAPEAGHAEAHVELTGTPVVESGSEPDAHHA